MNRISLIALCALLIAAPAVPAFAAGTYSKLDTIKSVPGKVYRGGVSALQQTEDHLTSCLQHVFGFFNPCLDLARGCADVALYPIEKPLSLLDKSKAKPQTMVRVPKTTGTPAPNPPANTQEAGPK
jgi:hypothetical protein